MKSELLSHRTIDAQGKSRGWINGTPVTATQLRALGALLVDIPTASTHGKSQPANAASARRLRQNRHHGPGTPLGRLDRRTSADLELTPGHAKPGRESGCSGSSVKFPASTLLPEVESLNEEHQRSHMPEGFARCCQDSLQRRRQHTGALRNLNRAQAFLQAQRLIAPEYPEWAMRWRARKSRSRKLRATCMEVWHRA